VRQTTALRGPILVQTSTSTTPSTISVRFSTARNSPRGHRGSAPAAVRAGPRKRAPPRQRSGSSTCISYDLTPTPPVGAIDPRKSNQGTKGLTRWCFRATARSAPELEDTSTLSRQGQRRFLATQPRIRAGRHRTSKRQYGTCAKTSLVPRHLSTGKGKPGVRGR